MNRKDILNDLSIGNKAEAYEAFDDIPTNPNLSPPSVKSSPHAIRAATCSKARWP